MARILFTSTLEVFPWGGSEALWSATALRMRAAGEEIGCCVSTIQAGDPRVENLAVAGCAIFPRVFIPDLSSRLWNRFTPHAWKLSGDSSFTRTLKEFKPDLVVLSQGGNLCINPYATECQELGIPFCSIVQSVPEAMFIPDDATYPQLAHSYLAAQKVFFVSDGNRHILERQMATHIPRAGRCYNPVNLTSREPEPWPQGLDYLAFACVARMEFYAKGQDLILEVLDLPKWRERPIRVTFYGAGPNQRLLKNLINFRNLPSASYGGVTSDIRELWSRHHALILPSRQEGLPLSLVEAALCGRPSVVTRIAGNTEVSVEGVSGFVAAAPVFKELDAAMERAWHARADLEQMGMNAHQRIAENFPMDPIGHMTGALEEILGGL